MSQMTEYSFGYDPIVIRKYVDGDKGGKLLDVTGFTDAVIKAGHVVIRDTATQSTYKPMPVSNGAYAALPQGYEYVGIVVGTVPTNEPYVAIITIGEVNEALHRILDSRKDKYLIKHYINKQLSQMEDNMLEEYYNMAP